MPCQNQTFMSRLLKSASLFGIKRQFIFPTWIKRFFGSRVICSIIELSALDPVQRSMTSAQISISNTSCMFDANNISLQKVLRHIRLKRPADWLQNYFNTIQTPNTLENRNIIIIFTRIFHPKIGRQIRIFSLRRKKKYYSYKKDSALRKHWECSYPCTLCALFGSRLW